jgi:hypothetical protein
MPRAVTTARVTLLASLLWIASLPLAAADAPAPSLGFFAGTWQLERSQPRAAVTDPPTRLTIDVVRHIVTVTATTTGGTSGLRSVLDRYECDGIERIVDIDRRRGARTCRALRAGRGFEVIERSQRAGQRVQVATHRWTRASGGRLTIVSRIEEEGRGQQQRRTYRRR